MDMPTSEPKVLMQCKGTVAAALVNGEVDVAVTEDALVLSSLFDTASIGWAEVTALGFADYVLSIQTAAGGYQLAKLGASGQPLYDQALAAYNAKVRESLFVSGDAAATATGDVGGKAAVPIEVYENCVLSLPPDVGAVRVPLCFATGFSDADYQIRLDWLGGTAVYARLGYGHAPVSKAIQDGIKALRAKSAAAFRELDAGLSDAQCSQLARLLPEGAAAPASAIQAIAPKLLAALEDKLAASRAAQTYEAFKQLCDPGQICIGLRKNESVPGGGLGDVAALLGGAGAGGGIGDALGGLAGGGAGGLGDMLGGVLGGGAAGGQDGAGAGGLGAMLGGLAGAIGAGEADGQPAPAADPFELWLIAPSANGQACAVEFAGEAGESAATFVYRFQGGFDDFRLALNIALEAIAFKREVIRLSDAELQEPKYAKYRMANDRNQALRLVRASFAGRAIHASPESWHKQLLELFG